MITEIDHGIHIDTSEIDAELGDATPEQLYAEFNECVYSLARSMTRCAWILNRLREQGRPLPEKVPPICLYIADGRLHPDLAPMILKSPAFDLLRQLPLTDQRHLVDEPVQPVLDGADIRMVNLCEAPRAIVKKAIGQERRLTTIEEQRAQEAQAAMSQRIAATKPKGASEPPTERRHRPIKFKVSDNEYEILTRAGLASRPVRSADDMALRFMIAGIQSEHPKG